MADSKTRSTTQANPKLQAAASLVLEKEEKRQRRASRREKRQKRQREKEQLAAVQRMRQSIEVMKWCIIGITTIMFLGIVVAIWTLSAVHAEVVKVQSEVEKVQPKIEKIVNELTDVVSEVERVRESLRNPMQSIGTAFGKELDAKLQSFIGNKLGTSGD